MSATKLGRVVIVDGARYRSDDFAFERSHWEPLGIHVRVERCETEEQIIATAQDADVVVYLGLYAPFTRAVIQALPRCRLIARYGIGMDSVDIPAATEQGMVVANAAEYCVPEVADHATALILALARRITLLDRHLHGGQWANALELFPPVPRLSTLTLGIVGFGRIGQRVARNVSAMVGEILAADPYVTQEAAAAHGAQLASLDELLARSDFVTLHTPLLPATRGLVGATQLARMKPTAYLINTSRGPVVDEAALIDALQKGVIAGAALDVFDSEPLAQDSPLRDMDNVILTPHFAAYSEQALEDLRASVVRTVIDVLQDRWPPFVMNPTVQPRTPLHTLDT
jgi:D-3-phosphoglycerate dehydrogenase